MKLFQEKELEIANAIATLNFTNPFLPERVECEKKILGRSYKKADAIWSMRYGKGKYQANLKMIKHETEAMVAKLSARLKELGGKPSEEEFLVYEDVVIYHLFERYREPFMAHIPESKKQNSFDFYTDFESEFKRFLEVAGRSGGRYSAKHVFAIFYQVHRAFYYIFDHIVGGSMPMARLRAECWQSVFTHDIRRYHRALYMRMNDISSLVTGPSGTGKELVARAIALSRYIPFNSVSMSFEEDSEKQFFPLHLSAMSQNLIESELFGHRKGAYTGAVQDRSGWLELCSENGTVFLDEIGEINEEIQVKLLRVLQDRSFQKLGENRFSKFSGKIISATNRDLQEEIEKGRFRKDLYYRLCSDIIRTPSLYEQLMDSPKELENLVEFLAVRIVGPEEAWPLTEETLAWIGGNLDRDYSWPGNVRELEQCVRNILIRGSYSPPPPEKEAKGDPLMQALNGCALTADELLSLYCSIVFDKTGKYSECAKILDIDRRTVKSKVLSIKSGL